MAGARRRYQRIVPRAIARTAARSGDVSKPARATSADRPSESTASNAWAAPASADAPGAHGDLAKAQAWKSPGVGKIPHRHRTAPWPLHLRDSERANATGNRHGITLNRNDHPRIGAFRHF
jgi:hypothetical protein